MRPFLSLETATLVWIAAPFLIGFSIYLLPKLARVCALVMALLSLGYGLSLLVSDFRVEDFALTMQLMDSFGVTLQADALSGYFVLTNALVTAAVLLYCWQSNNKAYFYTQAMILHGSVNAVFICSDFISLYVALEVIGVASFLLITHARSDRAIWVGLRYLFVSNTAMLFYLMGAALLYGSSGTFAFSGLGQASPESLVLMTLGLLTKGGIFVSGLWLPLTHSEAETPVSAMLSGVVVKTGVFPLVRCALMFPELQPLLGVMGLGTALLGVSYAMVEQDTKRMLALSTISQMGFLLVSPAAAGFYALTHGLAKASLFLVAGNLPSRDFRVLRKQSMPRSFGIGLAIAALSVSGLPLLAGYGAKTSSLKPLEGVSGWLMTLAAVGTAIVCAKLLFLPWSWTVKDSAATRPKPGLKFALVVTCGGLFLGNIFALEAYSLNNVIKSLVVMGLGWLVYGLAIQRFTLKPPAGPEKFENLIGTMSLVAILLFGLLLYLPKSAIANY